MIAGGLMLVGLTACLVGILGAEVGATWPIVTMVCGFGVLVGGWLMLVGQLHQHRSCPRCGTPTPAGLYCDQCGSDFDVRR